MEEEVPGNGGWAKDGEAEEPARVAGERECCLLVLNLVSSTPPGIRQPGPRLRVLGVCDFV